MLRQMFYETKRLCNMVCVRAGYIKKKWNISAFLTLSTESKRREFRSKSDARKLEFLSPDRSQVLLSSSIIVFKTFWLITTETVWDRSIVYIHKTKSFKVAWSQPNYPDYQAMIFLLWYSVKLLFSQLETFPAVQISWDKIRSYVAESTRGPVISAERYGG